VISAPVHVQDFPARYSPQMGIEGANVLFDTWVHPLMMGLEEHLLGMFKGDVEFHEDAAPSHLGRAGTPMQAHVPAAPLVAAAPSAPTNPVQVAAAVEAAAVLATAAQRGSAGAASTWAQDAELELKKIPFFVRGKARRNTERYALERGLATITVETLYDAKAHFSR
jgi:light-independent protochlorophyllide reductase subunit B